MSPFWLGFEKQANKLTDTAKAVFRGAENVAENVAKGVRAAEPHTIDYRVVHQGRQALREGAHSPVLDYSRGGKLEREFWDAQRKSKLPTQRLAPRVPESQKDLARQREATKKALPGRFARDEGVGVKAG